jgi:hypothetical protein
MRPIRDYPLLDLPDLAAELAEIGTLLSDSMTMLGRARTVLDCDNLQQYYQAEADSHAARQRIADYMTQNQRADVVELEMQVAAYRVNYELLTNIIGWRVSDRVSRREDGVESASRL